MIFLRDIFRATVNENTEYAPGNLRSVVSSESSDTAHCTKAYIGKNIADQGDQLIDVCLIVILLGGCVES